MYLYYQGADLVSTPPFGAPLWMGIHYKYERLEGGIRSRELELEFGTLHGGRPIKIFVTLVNCKRCKESEDSDGIRETVIARIGFENPNQSAMRREGCLGLGFNAPPPSPFGPTLLTTHLELPSRADDCIGAPALCGFARKTLIQHSAARCIREMESEVGIHGTLGLSSRVCHALISIAAVEAGGCNGLGTRLKGKAQGSSMDAPTYAGADGLCGNAVAYAHQWCR
ncbi:hypothetical protein BDZ97DRAFT_1757213 [Flammula alnicola]|nr:hypothetical protein BDZ97DRAFT_1757213 [Flammula alnicola]